MPLFLLLHLHVSVNTYQDLVFTVTLELSILKSFPHPYCKLEAAYQVRAAQVNLPLAFMSVLVVYTYLAVNVFSTHLQK